MEEEKQYVLIMLQSLQKKEKVLDSIIQYNKKQRVELENPSLSADEFDRTVEDKAALLEQLELLDSGFEKLYEKVKEELSAHRENYRSEILQMQEAIRRLTEKSVMIQTQEARNRQLMVQKFNTVKKQIREVRSSQRVVNQYYKNMVNRAYAEPQFLDNKK